MIGLGKLIIWGKKRDGYNLHPGSVSYGCITINVHGNHSFSPQEREKEWNIIHDVITGTKTEKVTDNRGLHKYYPGKQIKYGT